tara:strand:+ start:22247 stop:22957 length:711 start_codon:yes stop_codon:yes gene_type:complete
MSKRTAQTVDPDVSAGTERDQAGYCNPPQATRFKAGKSGNPKGRPKKKPAASVVPHMSEERMKDIIQEEAYRTIPVRDGDKTVEIPVVQAIFRRVALEAAKGNVSAQKMFTDSLKYVEGSRKALHDEYLKTMIEYKADGMREIARCKELEIDPPEMIPHPDDIYIDMNTGRIEMRGPMTPEDKKIWDEKLKLKRQFIRSIEKLEKLLAKNPGDKAVAERLMIERQVLERITEEVPD